MKKSNLDKLLIEIHKRISIPEKVFICDTQELADRYKVRIGTTIHEPVIPKLVIENYEN